MVQVSSSHGLQPIPENVGGFTRKSPHLLVVDDFYEQPLAVRELALQQTFVAHERYHKGRRTETRHLFPYQKEEFERLLGVKIRNWMNYGTNGIFQYCLPADPIVFHSDEQTYAGVIYLTPDAPANCGTSFFKSRATGLRRPPNEIDAARVNSSVHELAKRTYDGKLLDPSAWELVDTVGNVFNRLVIWDSKMIHAASRYFGDQLLNARLFHLFFFDVH